MNEEKYYIKLALFTIIIGGRLSSGRPVAEW